MAGGRPRISKIHCIQIENLKPFFGSQRLRHFVVAALRLVVALSTVGGGCYTPSHLTNDCSGRFVTCVQIAPKGPFNLPFPCISAEHFCRFSRPLWHVTVVGSLSLSSHCARQPRRRKTSPKAERFVPPPARCAALTPAAFQRKPKGWPEVHLLMCPRCSICPLMRHMYNAFKKLCQEC